MLFTADHCFVILIFWSSIYAIVVYKDTPVRKRIFSILIKVSIIQYPTREVVLCEGKEKVCWETQNLQFTWLNHGFN